MASVLSNITQRAAQIQARHTHSAFDPLAGLNQEQRQAAMMTEGAVLVLSGAGTGKTRVITHRIAHLITGKDVLPNQILAVTFTNKAAGEMRERVLRLLQESGGAQSSQPVLLTFHSFGARLLRRFIEELGIRGLRRSFTIYDETDSIRVIKALLKEIEADEKALAPKNVADCISKAKGDGLFAADFPATIKTNDETRQRIARLYMLYEARLRTNNALDFDDLLLLSVKLLRDHEDIRTKLARRFHYLLVDEFQDTCALQIQLMKYLSSVHHNVCVVADDDQSIYAWRGADIKNVTQFERHFPQPRVVRLERNYRSTPQIIAAATKLISINKERRGKTLWTMAPAGAPVRRYEAVTGEDEANYVAEQIKLILDGPQDEIPSVGVLYRTNAQSRLLEEALRTLSIPHTIVGGLSFYARAEIKDMLSYAKLAANTDDRAALERAISAPARGIGEKALEKIYALSAQKGETLWKTIESEAMPNTAQAALSRKAAAALSEFYRLIEELKAYAEGGDVSGFFSTAIDKSGYGEVLRRDRSDEAASRLENLGELINAAADYDGGQSGLRDFIDHAALISKADEGSGEERAPVVLTTVHAAKGLEWPHVFICGLEQGLFPLSRSSENESGIEEERRLMYVAITRAKRELTLSYALNRRFFGREYQKKTESNFLLEIKDFLV